MNARILQRVLIAMVTASPLGCDPFAKNFDDDMCAEPEEVTPTTDRSPLTEDDLQRMSADGGTPSCRDYCSIIFDHLDSCRIIDLGPADGGSTDGGSTDGGSTDAAASTDAGRSLEVECVGRILCMGRRPAGLDAVEPAGCDLGAHFAAAARLEAASIDAFRVLTVELRAHGAPRTLIAGARRARRDEIRHRRVSRALARRYGARASSPRSTPSAVRPLSTIAIENAVEGCVREMFGALVAWEQATTATDPVVRAAMRRIARDETRHAALAWAIDAWLRPRLTRHARACVTAAREAAFEDLADVARALPEAGLPGPTRARELVKGLRAWMHLRD